MKIHAWRIVRRARVDDAYTGEGARLYGGRWNSPGTAIVYASDSLALAALETLTSIFPRISIDHVCFEITFDSRLVETVESVPDGWDRRPASPLTQHIGDLWATELRTAILSIPSILIPSQRTYLLNPKHPDFSKITIGPMRPFPFDPRLT